MSAASLCGSALLLLLLLQLRVPADGLAVVGSACCSFTLILRGGEGRPHAALGLAALDRQLGSIAAEQQLLI